ncbi:MAG: succinate dehydrogenase [Oscillospiraceae bacterium]|nr:succinate dehydrogenase [Oscillospiraceae bacterium]
MKILIRLLTAPIAVIVWLCAGLLYVSSFLFGLAGAALTVLAVVVILAGSLKNGIIVLIIAFLVSPLGLPMLAVKILVGLQGLRNTLVNWF